jgi:tetratricopeptide (TPR) repeat protein
MGPAILNSPEKNESREGCECGSGLRRDHCCLLDSAAARPETQQVPEIDKARAALAAGDIVSAERLLIDALEKSPRHTDGLMLLYKLRAQQDRMAAAEVLLKRVVRLDPNNLAATQALALLLFGKGSLIEAEQHARNAVRIAPINIQSHNLMGMIMTEAHRPQVGEYHYRRAIELLGKPNAILLSNLAWNLKTQGRIAEARQLYEESVSLDPTVFQAYYGWARMEETDRNFARCSELLDAADRLSPGNPDILLQRAVLHGRVKDYDKAVAVIDGIRQDREGRGLRPVESSERGILLDKMGWYQEAFAAFDEAKRTLRETTNQSYLAEDAASLVSRLAAFFISGRMQILPRASIRADTAQPIFIVGFPRSGTTMVEQMLSAHPAINAGDELPIVHELTRLIPRMLESKLHYPDALAELWLGDKVEGLDNLRDYYLQRARQLGAIREGTQWFTDKMPLNETHLGLISLVFPQAPVIHLLRHPLDVVLSVFANNLTHGFYCAYDLTSIARHYVLVMELVEHYRRELSLRYLAIRYEDVIDQQEASLRRMLDFIGAPYDQRCLDFHENRRYARTASYAQVTEQLHDRSRYRYRNYREQLAPVIPILEPVMARLGYTLD